MIVIHIILTVYAVFAILLSSLIFALLNFWLLFVPIRSRNKVAQWTLIRPWTFVFNHLILMIRLKIFGRENVDPKRVTLYISNHQSWIDIPTFLSYCRSTAIAKKEVQRIPLVGLLAIYAGGLFFDRNKKNSRVAIMKDVFDHFKSGASVGMFPEGTRSRDGEILKANLSMIKLCYKHNIPVVSSAIAGTRNALPIKRFYFKFFQKIVIKYNPPLYPADFPDEDSFAKSCWDLVKSTHSEIKALV